MACLKAFQIIIGSILLWWIIQVEAATTHSHVIELVIVVDYSDYKYVGCEHDGDGNKCKDDDGYVMAVAQDVDHINRWQFSSCSADYIKEYISNITRNMETCMDSIQNHHPANLLNNASWYGQLYNADKQCQIVQGDGSFFCRSYYDGDFSAVCQKFLCHDLYNVTCYYKSDGMADGSPCGPGKWCMSNKCVDTNVPVHVTDRCFAGEQTGFVRDNKTCAELVKKKPNVCNDNDIKYICCKSCQGVTTTSVNINTQCMEKYGDRSRFCITDDYSNNTSDVLCRKLYCVTPKNQSSCHSTIADDKTVCGNHKWCIDGKCVYNNQAPYIHDECTWSDVVGVAGYNVTCKQVAEPRNQWLCYKNSISKLCCNTCCKYGDKSPDCAGLLPNNSYWCYDSKNVNLCCGTCAKIFNKTRTGCEYGDKSDWCIAHVANKKEKYNCYKNQDLCCESCHQAKKSGHPGCPYGDHSDWCLTHIANNTYKGGCYSNVDFCCGTCSKIYKADHPDCEYGDRNSDCATEIPNRRDLCYDQKWIHSCCDSCPKHANTGHPDCLYGDFYTDCSAHKCSRYTAETQKKCCDTCKDSALVG